MNCPHIVNAKVMFYLFVCIFVRNVPTVLLIYLGLGRLVTGLFTLSVYDDGQ